MSAHPGTWAAWAAGATFVTLGASDPGSLALVFVAVCATGLTLTGGDGTSWTLLLKLGLAFAVIRVVLFGLTGHTGATTLVMLPTLELPRLLGGLVIGGRVTGEVVVTSVVEGMRLATLLTIIGVALAAVPAHRVLRMVPRFLAEVGLVVGIALAFVPTLARSVADVRDAQRARGHRARGPRSLVAIVVPVLATALERSMTLATSMEVRGYGRLQPARSRAANAASTAGLIALSGGVAALLFGRLIGVIPAVAGMVAVWWGLRVPAGRTRLRGDPFTRTDLVGVVVALGAIPVSIIARAAAGAWSAHPVLATPNVGVPELIAPLLVAAPVLVASMPAARSLREARLDVAPEGVA